MTAGEVLDMPVYHPTLAEGLRPALRDLCDQVSADRPWDRNDEDRPGK
jgi:dihydrolipoamide dehydrogenase